MDTKTAYRIIERRRIITLLLYMITVLMFVFSIVSFFLFRERTFICIVFSLLFYALVVLRADRVYSRTFVRMNLLVGTGRLFDECIYQKRGGVTRDDIKKSGMLPTVEKEGNDVVSGPTLHLRKGKTEILSSSILSYYPLPKGADRHKIALLKGMWFSSVVALDGDIAIVREGAIHSSRERDFFLKQNLEDKSNLLSDDWDGFHLYSSSLSDSDLRLFLKRVKSISGSVTFSTLRVHDGRIYLFVAGRNLLQDYPVYKGPSMELIEKNRLPETVMLLSLVSSYSR